MGLFMKSIVQMGIFMICAQVLIHFRPNGSYEKYMKLLVSIMILIQVMSPIVSLITGGKSNLTENVARFEEQMQAGMEEAREAAEQSDRLLNRMTMEQLKEQIGKAQEEAQQAELQQDTSEGQAGSRETKDSGTEIIGQECSEKVERIDTGIEKITIKIGGE